MNDETPSGRLRPKGSAEEIVSFIKANSDFLIATHVNPEGDAFGSAVALAMALESLGKKAAIYERDKVAEFYAFLPGIARVTDRLPAPRGTESLSLILVDCNTSERAAVENLRFKNTAVIDHHETEREFGDVRWIDPGAPAAGLLVYRLLKELEVEITREIAVNLYAAIAVDTGTFRFSNTTPEALRAAARLAEAGAEPGPIADAINGNWSRARFRLLCAAMGGLEILDGGGTALMVITKEMLKAAGAEPEDTENFSNFPRIMKDVKVAVLLRETAEGWKASLRSKGDTNVARVAEKLGGGGHKNAAGCTIKADFETAKKTLLEAIRKII